MLWGIMIFGHATTTFLVVRAAKRNASPFLIGTTIVGAYFPDMIDKGSVMLLGVGSERGFGHTLLFQLFVFAIAISLGKIHRFAAYKEYFLWFSIGSFLHLLEDFIAPQIAFWPLLGSMPPALNISLQQMMIDFYVLMHFPVMLTCELLGHAVCAAYFVATALKRIPRLSRVSAPN